MSAQPNQVAHHTNDDGGAAAATSTDVAPKLDTPPAVVTKPKRGPKHAPNPLKQQWLRGKADPAVAGDTSPSNQPQSAAPELRGEPDSIPLSRILFTQDTINHRFSNANYIMDETVDFLFTNGSAVKDASYGEQWLAAVRLIFRPVRVFEREGHVWSLDNRRLFCMKVSADRLGIDPIVDVLKVKGNAAAKEFRSKLGDHAVYRQTGDGGAGADYLPTISGLRVKDATPQPATLSS